VKLGIIARSDNSGLGNQTRELVHMLNPDKVMVIDFSEFKKKEQHPEWYDGYNVQEQYGYPDINSCKRFLEGLDVVLTCETFYHKDFVALAGRYGVKTVQQYNYEFFENMLYPYNPVAQHLLSPSLWGFDEVARVFGHQTKLTHLPPPTNPDNFKNARENNLSKKHKRFLHILGTAATKDRNGTQSIIEMLRYSKADYELVIRTQEPLDIAIQDPRITIDFRDLEKQEDLYDGFDALILPRRYGGLCLPMNEALMSGIPVFMTDISPNNTVLPEEWVVPAKKIGEFNARVVVDVYDADIIKLAELVDNYANSNDQELIKKEAFRLGLFNFDPKNLKERYDNIIHK
jgi:hypothetical protein